jgi:hypothetical protein
MAKYNELISMAGNWVRAIFRIENEYKLTKFELPELYKLNNAHRTLMQAYVASLGAVSRLSFFVSINELQPPKESWLRRIIHFIVWGKISPFRLLIWRPAVKLYVESHIHKKMNELAIGYSQLSLLVPELHSEEAKYLKWLVKAKNECEQLTSTISSGKIFLNAINYVLFVIANLFVAAWGAANLFDLIIRLSLLQPPKIAVEIIGKFLVFTFLALPFILAFVDVTFYAKRVILLNIGIEEGQPAVYKLENNLFSLINRGKTKETPLDLLILSFYFWAILGFLWLIHLLFVQASKVGNIVICDFTWCLIIPMILFLFTDVVLPWWKRSVDGDM